MKKKKIRLDDVYTIPFKIIKAAPEETNPNGNFGAAKLNWIPPADWVTPKLPAVQVLTSEESEDVFQFMKQNIKIEPYTNSPQGQIRHTVQMNGFKSYNPYPVQGQALKPYQQGFVSSQFF